MTWTSCNVRYNNVLQAQGAALQNTQAIVDMITVDQLHLPTPCEDWDVEMLIHHIVYGNWWVAPLVKGETIEQIGDRFEGDILGGNFSNAHTESSASAADAFLAPGALDRPCAVSYGPVTGSVYCGHRLTDVLVHGWDLPMATSGDTRLPPDLVQICIEVALPQIDMLAGSGVFGTVTDPGEAADPQTRLLALLGRTS
jgi:uncharacterized protein (TIGR03086 family)